MYTKEEIRNQLKGATDFAKKYFSFAQYITGVILKEELENSSKEEYYEGLIFSTCLVSEYISPKDIEKRRLIQTIMINELMIYSMKFDEFSLKMGTNSREFLSKRFMLINSEIQKIGTDTDYIAASLINNLYINPLNDINLTINEIMENTHQIELHKLSKIFLLKLSTFLEILDDTNELIRKL